MDKQQTEINELVERLFYHLDEQQRLINSLFALIDKLRAVALGINK